MRMTTQDKLDCLLKHFDALAESQGDVVALSNKDVKLLNRQRGFANLNEIGFYIRALGKRGLLNPDCAADNTILQARITIDGYCYLDTLDSGAQS